MSDLAAAGAFAIGNAFNGQPGSLGAPDASDPAYVLAHAALGCASSAALGTGCAGGAIGGAVSAATANEIATAVTGGQGVTDQGQLAAIVAATTLLGGATAGLLGQNVQGAVTAAQNETLNNTCAEGHSCGTLASALKDTGRAAWNTALGVAQSIPNAVNGALPGYPDYVPFLSGAMLPYDDPDFGSLVSLVGAVGAGALAGGSSARSAAAEASSSGAAGTAIQTYWPPNSGFFTQSINQTLESGTLVNRYGGFYDTSGNFVDYGNFVAPANVPYGMRALPPEPTRQSP